MGLHTEYHGYVTVQPIMACLLSVQNVVLIVFVWHKNKNNVMEIQQATEIVLWFNTIFDT